MEGKSKAPSDLLRGEPMYLKSRGISEATCKKFGYIVTSQHGKPVQAAPYRNQDGEIVAQHIRGADKKFGWVGKPADLQLYGQHLWPTTGKRLVITEGEHDAHAVAQSFGLSWPVVSVPNGAAGALKDIKRNLKFIEGYDDVVICFDMDEPGQEAAVKCAAILKPGKARIAHMPTKDANDLLRDEGVKAVGRAIYDAKEHRPDGVINCIDLSEKVKEPVVMGELYPWRGLNDLLYGQRRGEIITLGAGSGVGKSAICAEIAYTSAMAGQTVGYVALEEGVTRTARRFVGIHMNKPIHLPGIEYEEAVLQRAIDETLGTKRFFTYDHFGSMGSDSLMENLRFLGQGCGCDFLVLDHISIVVSGMDIDGDERRAIDNTMTQLRSFTEETGTSLFLVSHLRRPQGRGHENGAEVSLSDFRGSASIAQLSDIVIGAERDQQAEEEADRNTTMLRVLKNRYSGETGPACELLYSKETGRLTERTDFDDGAPPWKPDAEDVSDDF